MHWTSQETTAARLALDPPRPHQLSGPALEFPSPVLALLWFPRMLDKILEATFDPSLALVAVEMSEAQRHQSRPLQSLPKLPMGRPQGTGWPCQAGLAAIEVQMRKATLPRNQLLVSLKLATDSTWLLGPCSWRFICKQRILSRGPYTLRPHELKISLFSTSPTPIVRNPTCDLPLFPFHFGVWDIFP